MLKYFKDEEMFYIYILQQANGMYYIESTEEPFDNKADFIESLTLQDKLCSNSAFPIILVYYLLFPNKDDLLSIKHKMLQWDKSQLQLLINNDFAGISKLAK